MRIKQIGLNNYHEPIEQVLLNRGIKMNHVKYFNPTRESLLDPRTLKNMELAVDKILRHVERGSNIHILQDEDIDGVTSNAGLYLLVEYLIKLKSSNSKLSYSVHSKKEHGIKIDQLEDYMFDVLLMADGGSSDYYEHSYYNKKGIDVICLDHHPFLTYSEHAVIVNPQMDDYENKSLSGAGVVFKFAQLILHDALNGEETKESTDLLNKITALASLGIVSDMMEVKDLETRYIVKTGLQYIGHFPLFREIMNSKKIGTPMISDISFYIAPYVNATTRIGTVAQKMRMFEAIINPWKPIIEIQNFEVKKSPKSKAKGAIGHKYLFQEVAQDLIKTRELQNEMIAQLKETIDMNVLAISKVGIITVDKNCLVKGVLANSLSNEFKKPMLVVALSEKGKECMGSARGFYTYTDDFRKDLNDSKLFMFAEGHGNAFGVGFKVSKLKKIVDFFEKKYSVDEYSYPVDFTMKPSNLKDEFFEEIEKYKAEYGKGIEEPMVAVLDIPYTEKDIFYNEARTVLKISNSAINVVKFSPKEEDIEAVKNANSISVVGRVGINVYNNMRSPQLTIIEYECGRASVVAPTSVVKKKVPSWF